MRDFIYRYSFPDFGNPKFTANTVQYLWNKAEQSLDYIQLMLNGRFPSIDEAINSNDTPWLKIAIFLDIQDWEEDKLLPETAEKLKELVNQFDWSWYTFAPD